MGVEELGTGAGWGVSPAGVGRRGRGNWAMTPGLQLAELDPPGIPIPTALGLGWVGLGSVRACISFHFHPVFSFSLI